MLFMRIITLVCTSFYQIMIKRIWIIEHSIHFPFSLFLLMTESNDLNDSLMTILIYFYLIDDILTIIHIITLW